MKIVKIGVEQIIYRCILSIKCARNLQFPANTGHQSKRDDHRVAIFMSLGNDSHPGNEATTSTFHYTFITTSTYVRAMHRL